MSDDIWVATEDVRAIAKELGLGDHTRPYSAHEVVQQEILPAIRRLRESGLHPKMRCGNCGVILLETDTRKCSYCRTAFSIVPPVDENEEP